jgi:MoaA/NifB/PqqE/SkfB family radical SAM enzyme
MFPLNIDDRTFPLPRVAWIELTSRCPFNCIFCTRASLRGAGEHLDFTLYCRLIAELARPRIIRLNYAGESGHYPLLAEAVALASNTGAEVELVTALASLKMNRLRSALQAGLTRLTVSLHTLVPASFESIYGFSSLDEMQERLRQVIRWRDEADLKFTLDLAFVAMRDNLHELPSIARFAEAHRIPVLAVHPLIGRDPLPLGVATEHLPDGSLLPAFRDEILEAVQAARDRAPGVTIQVSSHEMTVQRALDEQAQPWPGPLPPGARIGGCDQSPFESIHVLSDGRVVACEVTEHRTLGNLNRSSLLEIWNGKEYREFRQRHLDGDESDCRRCIYKTAYAPAAERSCLVAPDLPEAQLLRGWHADDGSGLRWSSGQAALSLLRARRHRRVHLRGVLAPQRPGHALFAVRIDGTCVYRREHATAGEVDLWLPIPGENPVLVIELDCAGAASPAALDEGPDVRELGFALVHVESAR